MRLPPRQAVMFGATMLVLIVLIAGGFKWRTEQTDKAAEESRKADYAQCIAINDNRQASRRLATIQYATVSDRLRYDPPENQKLVKAFERRLLQLEKLLKAQQPLDCASYVRPDLPPDSGVR